MSIDNAVSAVTHTAAAGASASRALVRREQGNGTARPAVGKHALLHARRLREREARMADNAPDDGELAIRLRTEDGAVVYVLRPATSGLVIERIQRRPLGACFMQSLLFTDREGFDRWCESDAIRFDEPVLYNRLCREGQARLGGKR